MTPEERAQHRQDDLARLNVLKNNGVAFQATDPFDYPIVESPLDGVPAQSLAHQRNTLRAAQREE